MTTALAELSQPTKHQNLRRPTCTYCWAGLASQCTWIRQSRSAVHNWQQSRAVDDAAGVQNEL